MRSVSSGLTVGAQQKRVRIRVSSCCSHTRLRQRTQDSCGSATGTSTDKARNSVLAGNHMHNLHHDPVPSSPSCHHSPPAPRGEGQALRLGSRAGGCVTYLPKEANCRPLGRPCCPGAGPASGPSEQNFVFLSDLPYGCRVGFHYFLPLHFPQLYPRCRQEATVSERTSSP